MDGSGADMAVSKQSILVACAHAGTARKLGSMSTSGALSNSSGPPSLFVIIARSLFRPSNFRRLCTSCHSLLSVVVAKTFVRLRCCHLLYATDTTVYIAPHNSTTDSPDNEVPYSCGGSPVSRIGPSSDGVYRRRLWRFW
jgi:hypothetical protein